MNYLAADDPVEKAQTRAWIETMVAGLGDFACWKDKYAFFTTFTPTLSYKKPARADFPAAESPQFPQYP